MKVLSVLVVAVVAFLAVSLEATPVNHMNGPEDIQNFLFGEPQNSETAHLRMRRAACDLFGFKSKWFTPGDSVCALHCISLGNRGGNCQGSVCHCRK